MSKHSMTRAATIMSVAAVAVLALAWLAAAEVAAQAPPAAGAAAGKPPVIDVLVEGNRRVTTDRILSQMRLRPGSLYSPEEANEDWKRIFALKEFQNVVITPEAVDSGVRLRVTVAELPLLAGLEFVGAKKIKPDELSRLTGLSQGAPFDLYRALSAAGVIVQQYKRQGYYFAQVALDRDPLERSAIARFTISEGPKVRVRSIKFQGNASIGDAQLAKEIQTSKAFWFFTAGTFSEEILDDDVAKLTAYYVGQGFLDAKVGRKFDFDKKNENVDVTFLVEEGVRYRVASIAIRNTQALSSGYLAEQMKLRPGAFCTAEALQADRKSISDSYGRAGYIHALIDEPKIQFAPEPGKVDLVYDVTEGPKITIGEIFVAGNKVTRDKVILRELRFEPQDVADGKEFEDARARLLRTQLFRSADIHTLPTEKENVENVAVNVEEADTAMLLLGVGVNSNLGLIGNVTLAQRNFDLGRWPRGWDDPGAFKGAGQTLRLVLAPGTRYQEYSLGFTEPYFLDLPVRFDASGSFYNAQRDGYDEQRLGGQISFSKELRRDLYGSIGLRMEAIDIKNVDADAPPDVLAVQGNSLLSSVTLGLVRDKTDDPFLPTTGSRLGASVEQAGALGGDYTFTKFIVDGRRYWTVMEDALGRRTVFSLRGQAGFAAGDPPIFERFYAGGHGSLRGFEYRGVGPHVGNDPVGGDSLLLMGAEYRFPLVGKNFAGVLFLDAGTVDKNIGLGKLRTAAGFGLRFTVDMLGGQVPFALDFGFPLAKQSGDDTQVFSFSIDWTY